MEDVRDHINQEDPDFEAAREAFNRIEDVTYLDVSCGSGSFLIKAFDRFVDCYEEYKKLVRDSKKDGMSIDSFTASQTVGGDYERSILQNNIYGVDMDPQATEIASMNLLLKPLKKGKELPRVLNENLKTGNSLLNTNSDNIEDVFGDDAEGKEHFTPVDWKNEFAEVFEEHGGFTCIAGNPPWGAEMDSYEEWLESDDHYELTEGQYNSYELFLELGNDLLKEDGTLGLIIPDSIFNDDYEPLRRWLVDNNQLDRVYKLGEGLFDNVYASTAITQYTTTGVDGENQVDIGLLNKDDRERMMGSRGEALATLIEEKGGRTRQQRFAGNDNYDFKVWADESDHELMEVMESDTVDWNKVVDNGRGDETGKTGNITKCPYCTKWSRYPSKRGKDKGGGYYPKSCDHCDETFELEDSIETRQIVQQTPSDRCDRVTYFGVHVNRYRIDGEAYVDDDYDDLDYMFMDKERFEPPKLLIRRTGLGFFSTMDYSNARSIKANLVFRLLDDRKEPYSNYDLEYFLGFLNSRTMLYYYAKRRGIIEWQSFPSHTQTFIMSLPIPEVDWADEEAREDYNHFIELVEKAVEEDKKIDEDLDWEIENAVMDIYGIPTKQRKRIWDELKKLQRMKIVRELFPESG